jgi:hypothetical protein
MSSSSSSSSSSRSSSSSSSSRSSSLSSSSSSLTAEKRAGTNAYAVTYSYDGAGNRLTRRDGTTPTTNTYDVANQLT